MQIPLVLSLVRNNTSRLATAAFALTALLLMITLTTVVAGADPSAAAPQTAGADSQWSPAQQKAGPAGTKGKNAHPARFVPSDKRLLGAQPVLSYRGAADPTVARYPGGWVAISTGPGAPRAIAPEPGGPWTNIPSALTTRPSWASSSRFWASDLVEHNGTWLLYFSAEVPGLGVDGRCIGVATATDPTGTFIPDERPVVCPKQAIAPKAYDRIKRRGRDMPKSGVIDPDFFADRNGKVYLTYRTQSTPSSIRMVELPPSGRPEGAARSVELVRHRGVIENPALVRRGRQYVLITSEDDFTRCRYKTTYRRSMNLTDFSKSKRGLLLNTRKSGLCGAGGADLARAGNQRLIFFHAWTCPELGTNCPSGPNYDRERLYGAQRSMFAGVLRFTSRQAPRIKSWVTPILPPPPPDPTPPPEA